MKTFFTILISLYLSVGNATVKTDALAPTFSLMSSYGETVSLSNFLGKTVILEWTNHDCPFVAKHYKTGNMQETQEFVREEGAVWLTIISSAPGTQGYVLSEKANQLTYTRNASPEHVLFDPEGNVGLMYGAKTTPHMYIIDSNGFLRYQGAIDNAGGRGFKNRDLSKATNYVKEALKEISLKKRVTNNTTSPYGCSVKYKI